jgi:TPR repeat protein
MATKQGYTLVVWFVGLILVLSQNASLAQFESLVNGASTATAPTAAKEFFAQWSTNGVSAERFAQELKLAGVGNAEAQFHVALCYTEGFGAKSSPGLAASWCEKSAKQGYSNAEDLYGWMWETGFGVSTNAVTANDWYQKAADQNNPRGQYDLAYDYAYGAGIQQDYSKAFKLYEAAANQNYLPALHNLANAYLKGHGVEKNPSKAVELFKLAAGQGLRDAYWSLATYYGSDVYGVTNQTETMFWLKTGSEKNEPRCQNLYGAKIRCDNPADTNLVAEGWYWTSLAASNGLSDARCDIGLALIAGTYGLETNFAEGARYLHLAALHDNAKALNGLGYCYMNGLGVPQDFNEGMRLYQAAAEEGNSDAMANLALEYTKGRAVSKDERKALDWDIKAAEAGKAKSQLIVGKAYLYGYGLIETNTTLGLQWITKAAEQGYANAQLTLGCIYNNGIIVPKDSQQAEYWWQKVIVQSDVDALTTLAEYLAEKSTSREELERAFHLAKQAAQTGSPFGQYVYAEFLRGYRDIPPDLPEARRWYALSAAQGFAEGELKYAWLCLNGWGGERNPDDAFYWMKQAAGQGNVVASYQMGFFYKDGVGTSTNLEESFKAFKFAADNGLALAQFQLSKAYRFGIGVEKDDTQVLYWCQKAAQANRPEAELTLGMMYRAGEYGLRKDMDEAMKWLTAAANQGDAEAQNYLGLLYQIGKDIPQDSSAAVKWFARSARQGYAPGENTFGYALFKGVGGETNWIEAYKWLLLSAQQGNAHAQVNLQELDKIISPEQATQSANLAKEFVPRPEMLNTLKLPTILEVLDSKSLTSK